MFDGLISSFVKMREGNDDLKRVFLLIFREEVIIFDRVVSKEGRRLRF